jgi:hypothetical protein
MFFSTKKETNAAVFNCTMSVNCFKGVVVIRESTNIAFYMKIRAKFKIIRSRALENVKSW